MVPLVLPVSVNDVTPENPPVSDKITSEFCIVVPVAPSHLTTALSVLDPDELDGTIAHVESPRRNRDCCPAVGTGTNP